MEKHGLCAAFSEVSDGAGAFDVSRAMQHHKVIESFFDRITVVPFRFETVLEDLLDLELLLKERCDYYKEILRRLDGCAEMGIRAMVHESKAAPAAASEAGGFPSPDEPNPGKLFLWSRRIHYADESLLAEKHEEVSAKFRAAFGGLFKEFRSEASRLEVKGSDPGAVLISLYFLVPKEHLMSFRHRFDVLESADSSKLLLSGPWPPYNFVLPSNPQA
jgi:hypothetical protein